MYPCMYVSIRLQNYWIDMHKYIGHVFLHFVEWFSGKNFTNRKMFKAPFKFKYVKFQTSKLIFKKFALKGYNIKLKR